MKTLLLTILLASISFSCFAENTNGDQGSNKRHGPKDPDKIVTHMTKELSLSDEQAAQILSILKSKQADESQSRENQRKRHDKTRSEINAVLDDTQQQKFEENHKRRMEKRKQRQEPED